MLAIKHRLLFARIISILALQFFLLLLKHIQICFAFARILFCLLEVAHLLLGVAILTVFLIALLWQNIVRFLGAVWQ